MDLICKIRAETGGILPSHLDSSEKHIELGRGRISGFDVQLAIEVKLD
jgi:hypothetical protein